MFPSSHVNKVLSDQVCNDGVVAHLNSKSCKCLQPCESVQFQSSEQYDLLTDGGWQRGGNQTLLSFAEITVASQIDSFTEFNPFPFGKLIGAAGGAIGLYLGFSLVSLHEFTEKMTLQILGKHFRARHGFDVAGDDELTTAALMRIESL
jgi:hypothetical protein